MKETANQFIFKFYHAVRVIVMKLPAIYEPFQTENLQQNGLRASKTEI